MGRERATGPRSVASCQEKSGRRTARSTTLPAPPGDRTIDYADCRPELKNIDPGEAVLALERLRGFEHVMRPALDGVDAERCKPREGERKRRGRAPSYHALDYWRLEALRRIIGAKSTQATRDWLTTDKARVTRKLLGLHLPRVHHGGKVRKWMEGIPSDGWMSDFRTKWLREERFAELLQQLERWALAEKLATIPGAREECENLFADGSKLEIHGTPPKTQKGRVLNAKSITAPEAGYIPNNGSNADHAGAGWNILFIMTSKGTVLCHRRVPLNKNEADALHEMVEELGEALKLLGDEPALRTLSTDAAFHKQELRRDLRSIGVIENIHLSSHANKKSASESARRRNSKRYAIDGYPNWEANGHRELKCKCGKGKVSRYAGLNKRAKTVARVKGECASCGDITITSGLWRIAKNPAHFVRCRHDDRDHADWAFGNPLTYNDALAAEYGVPRFNSQEGAFGSQFTQRFELLKGKRWFYRGSQADLEVAAVVTITHALSLERHRRLTASSSPPTALAA